MRILGIVGETHDTGVALVEDGVPRLVVEEERLNREKHTLRFPIQSLKAVFDAANCSLQDIDVITTPWDIRRLRRSFFSAVLRNFPSSLNLLKPSAHPTQDSGIVLLNFYLRKDLWRHFGGRWRAEVIGVGHHESHASIYFVSPFEDATVLVMDGYGDDSATSAFVGVGNRLERKWHGEFFDSLGMVYTLVTLHLGFQPFEEGTVMALAACGEDTLVKKMRDIVHLLEGGRFAINKAYFSHDTHGMLRPFKPKFINLFGPPRKRDEPIADRHRDVARALQKVAEEVVVHVARGLVQSYPSRNLCLSGGVALNCVANTRLLEDTDFEHVWVPPCASDTGAPLGSALWHYHQTLGHDRHFRMTHAFIGTQFSDDQIRRALEDAGLRYERMSEHELLPRVARDLADSKIVGWFQGRFEIGPRALGNRSILASPLRLEIKDIINKRVKVREPFRPFAPAVLEERAGEYFEISEPDPFMTHAPRVRPTKTHEIPAVVHIDGTARVQTVDRNTNPQFHGLIVAFCKLTGVPVLLNTSFNKHEPIVARPEEAISCYLRTEMDILVLGDYYSTDRNREAVARARAEFRIREANLLGGE